MATNEIQNGCGLSIDAALASNQKRRCDFTAVVNSYPDIQFILPVMGWPIGLTEAGHRDWKRDMEALSSCENVAVKDFRDGMHLRP